MEIVVGLDLRPSSQGALQFARWLTATSTRRDEHVSVLHFLEQDHLQVVLRLHHLDEVLARASAAAQDLLALAGVSDPAFSLEVQAGTSAEVDLAAAVQRRGGELLIIGRLAHRGQRRVVRLGRVARSLVRAPPAPIVVVPPDLVASELGAGPVVLLTDLHEDTAPACRLAGALAVRLGRPLEVVHVMPDPLDVRAYGTDGAALERPLAEERRRLEEEARLWALRHGSSPRTSVALVGEVVGQAMARAVEVGAPLLVAGSRRMPSYERFIMPSVGRELAAHADVPVLIVPG